jgi:hypothetical protein
MEIISEPHDGRRVGRFNGDEVCDRHGRYLAEIRNETRLITTDRNK